jgi:hypothetical protein
MMALRISARLFGFIGLISAFSFVGHESVAQSGIANRSNQCDTARAIGHIKRVVGVRSDITIERALGGIARSPAPLTPICPADRIKVRRNSQAILDIYSAPPVTISGGAPWTAPTVSRQSSVTGNVWAFFVDKLAPDMARIQTQHRTRGLANTPPAPALVGISNQVARLNLDDLGSDLLIPISGWASLDSIELEVVGQSPRRIVGTLVELDENQPGNVPAIAFPKNQLVLGRYILKARLLPSSNERNASLERQLGGFEIVDGKAETLQTNGTQSPYNPATASALQALWLARSKPAQNGLMAYQIGQRGGSDVLPSDVVERLVLNYAKP